VTLDDELANLEYIVEVFLRSHKTHLAINVSTNLEASNSPD
jgi:hypothetical protein